MRDRRKRLLQATVASALTFVVMAIVVTGCGDVKINTNQLNTGKGSTSTDLSSGGVTPNSTWHNSYLTGPHGGYGCTDCHRSVARVAGEPSPFREIAGNQICAQCHMDAYNRTSLFNHQSAKAGTHCNSCHYSDSFRSKTRISHTQYHYSITGTCTSCHTGKTPSSHYSSGRSSNCESCHSYPTWNATMNHSATSNCASCHAGKKPRNHTGTKNGACEMCHSYPDWRNASFSHSGVSGNCASCHSRHYSGYACESCHTSGISWSYRHSRVRSDGCAACHDGGDGHGGDGHGGRD